MGRAGAGLGVATETSNRFVKRCFEPDRRALGHWRYGARPGAAWLRPQAATASSCMRVTAARSPVPYPSLPLLMAPHMGSTGEPPAAGVLCLLPLGRVHWRAVTSLKRRPGCRRGSARLAEVPRAVRPAPTTAQFRSRSVHRSIQKHAIHSMERCRAHRRRAAGLYQAHATVSRPTPAALAADPHALLGLHCKKLARVGQGTIRAHASAFSLRTVPCPPNLPRSPVVTEHLIGTIASHGIEPAGTTGSMA